MPGLYLIGAPLLRRRKSTLIDGAGDDARDLSAHLVGYLDEMARGVPLKWQPGVAAELVRAEGPGRSGRLELITPVSKPARCRPPAKRACSILRQRFITTRRPAPWASCRGLVVPESELGPERPGPDGDGIGRDLGEVLGSAEHVDEVRGLGEIGQRRVDRDGRGSTSPAG